MKKIKFPVVHFGLCHFLFLSVFNINAQDKGTLEKIQDEAFKNSEVMHLANMLTNVYAPRLSGSKEYWNAAKWIDSTLQAWNYTNVQLEPFDEKIKGWQLEHFSLEQIKPRYARISGHPLAWTSSTQPLEDKRPIVVPSISSLKGFREKYGGKLKDKIVLLESKNDFSYLNRTIAERFTDKELMDKSDQTDTRPLPPYEVMRSFMIGMQDSTRSFFNILKQEKVAALLMQSDRELGILRVEGTPFYRTSDSLAIPSFVVGSEDFIRMREVLRLGGEIKLRIAQKSTTYYSKAANVNVIAKIEGTDPNVTNEAIIIGAHLDTWHSGSGATDNSGNCAVIMEVARILKKYGPFRRSIMIALWGGEEQGVHGSTDYANKHFGNLSLGNFNTDSKNTNIYLNLDNGTGKIRGIYLQGNTEAKNFFKPLFGQIPELERGILSIENSIGSDHMVFDVINIPSFQFIQDPNGYNYLTNHTNLDTFPYLIHDDLKHNVAVIAKMVYLLSESMEKVPRK